ncbi:hypothetical protein QZH41_017982 [Actinostola sp. cb2023]|nr:hypothetical protein QZH41_017982 [Actinostola sp. cb2023]
MFALPDYVNEPEWLRIGRLTAETLIAVFGVLGNIGVVIAISRCPFMNTITNIFIRNLAIADLGVLVFSFPFAVVKEQTLLHWPLGRQICQVVYPLSEIFIGVSVWSMVVIAVDRYQGIVKDSHLKSLKIAFLICCLPWLISFLVISLPLLIVTRYWEGYGYQDCIQKWPEKNSMIMGQGYTILSSFYNYVLPLSIISWTYYKIFHKINQSDAFNKSNLETKALRNNSSCRFEKQRMKRNNRARKILTPVVVTFAVALLPVNVFRLTLVFIPSLVSYRYLWIIYNLCIIATVLSSSCNPFIYAIVSDNFRVAFKSMLKSKKNLPRRRTHSSAQFSLTTAAKRLDLNANSKSVSNRSNNGVPSMCSISSSV